MTSLNSSSGIEFFLKCFLSFICCTYAGYYFLALDSPLLELVGCPKDFPYPK